MATPEAAFHLPELTELRPNPELVLWVPTAEAAIQVGTNNPKDFKELALAIDPASITMRWKNKTPLDIDEVFQDDLLNEKRRGMLVRPVARFVLLQSEIADWWQLSEGGSVVIGGSGHLSGFLGLIASFALRKQDKEDAQGEQKYINSLLQEFDDEPTGLVTI